MNKKYSIGKYTASVLLAGTIAFGPATAGSVFAHGAPDADANNATEVDSGESTGAGNAILSQGEEGQEVTDLQQKMQDEGYDVNTDGVYDQNLQNKIVDFQYAQGWDADGVVDTPTLNALDNDSTVNGNDSEDDTQINDPNKPMVQSLSTGNDNDSGVNPGDAVSAAEDLVGTPYVWGGTDPKEGLDSSGFINAVFSDKNLSRTHAGMWANDGEKVDNPAPGDVVFFEGTYGSGVSHSGVYIGGDQMIHSGDESTGVEVTSMDIDYWNDKYIGAKRF